jgi:hypothetical protein
MSVNHAHWLRALFVDQQTILYRAEYNLITFNQPKTKFEGFELTRDWRQYPASTERFDMFSLLLSFRLHSSPLRSFIDVV